MVSPYQSASWTARLTLHLNFRTGTSEQSFGDFFVKNFQRHFFLACFVMQDVCIDHYQVEQMKKKVSSPILLSFFQMNNKTSGLICPHKFYTCCSPTLQLVLFFDVPPLTMVPQQVHHVQWLGWTCHGCPSTWWPRGDPLGVIFFRFFQFSRKCLFRHFFSVGHHCAYSLCLATP